MNETGKDVSRCAQVLTFLSGGPTLGLGNLSGYLTTRHIIANKRPRHSQEEGQRIDSLTLEDEEVRWGDGEGSLSVVLGAPGGDEAWRGVL